ncbi:hypothetical protein E2P81_ATG04691 [Venturia nashicola]|nr:hypothetical protein E2P81_ATG04691 [Venturia nashicola]
MLQSGSQSQPQGDYFNNDSQQPNTGTNPQTARSNHEDASVGLNELQPKAKRIACVLCRKRKLKCDGARPACGTCKRLSHDCAYDEVRKKSGPKRGYVKLLEARLQQVETLLKTQEPEQQQNPPSPTTNVSYPSFPTESAPPPTSTNYIIESNLTSMNDYALPTGTPMGGISTDYGFDQPGMPTEDADAYPWEMIGLGLDEPLPSQETIDDLYILFAILSRVYNMLMETTGLRYAMWTMAASVTDKYESLAEHLYHRARKYLQADEMKGHGEGIISVHHCQAWIIVTVYEFKNMYFPRAWQSTGRGVRMAQMLGLSRIDGSGLDVKQCLPPPKDWIEREERRRTFWMAFCEDRYASVGTGWPMTVDERDIMTNLPASEDSFEKGIPEQTVPLEQALKPAGAQKLSPLSGVVVMSCMFGRNLLHLHRPSPDDNDDNLNGEFWRRHRRIESILSHTALSLPDHLRLPAGLPDPNVVFMNMSIHTSAICLHQAAIFKADKHKLPPNVGSESRVRCVTAASEIARIMRMLSTLDLSIMNPFLAFCLYVAARVFVQYLKFRPKDEQMISSLQFLLAAMHALKRKNPLTESFLVQLDVDLEGMGMDVGQRPLTQAHVAATEMPNRVDSIKCSPIFEIRDSQAANSKYNRFGGGVPTFGDNGLGRHGNPTKPSTENPGPPFQTARANLNMAGDDTQTQSFDYLGGNNDSSPYNLPNRNRSRPAGGQLGGTRMTNLTDSLSPSESGSPNMNNDQQSTRRNSQRDSSSHTSFTPPSLSDNNETHHNSLNNANSPAAATTNNTNTNTNRTRVPIMADGNVFSMDTSFSSFQPAFLGQPIESTDSAGLFTSMGGGWEMSGIEITGTTSTGLTPGPTGLTPGPWNNDEFFKSMGTGWNNAGGSFAGENSNSGTTNDRRSS